MKGDLAALAQALASIHPEGMLTPESFLTAARQVTEENPSRVLNAMGIARQIDPAVPEPIVRGLVRDLVRSGQLKWTGAFPQFNLTTLGLLG